MSALLALPESFSPRDLHHPAPPRRDQIEGLREAACRAQASPRMDLFHACALLGLDPDRTAEAFRDALIRTLAQGLGRKAVFYRPGARELSFDEAWIMALIDAIGRNDEPSVAFLVHSRIAHHARRSVTFLATGLVRS